MSPAQISLAEVILAIDGRHTILTHGNSFAARNLSEALVQIQSAHQALLGTVTIAHLAVRVDPQDWVI